jgi:hypothetical protein
LKGDIDAIVSVSIEKVNQGLEKMCPLYPIPQPTKPTVTIINETVKKPVPHWVPALTPWEKIRLLRTEIGVLRQQLHQCGVTAYTDGQSWAANYAVRWGEDFIDPEDVQYWSTLAREAVYDNTGVEIEPGTYVNDAKSQGWEMIGYW